MKLPWLASHLSPAPARYLGLAEYVTGALLGDERLALDGLGDRAAGAGHRQVGLQALELAGVDRQALPAVAAGGWTGLARAEGARRWPALAETTWHPATGDGAASNVGAGCITPDQVAINIGTRLAIRAVEPADQPTGTAQLARYLVDDHRSTGGAAFPGPATPVRLAAPGRPCPRARSSDCTVAGSRGW